MPGRKFCDDVSRLPLATATLEARQLEFQLTNAYGRSRILLWTAKNLYSI